MSSFISFEGVSHAYGAATGTPAVVDLSIDIEEGEFAAVVGPSGCGKSTLMKLATGLQFPFKGKVRVANEVVTRPVKIAGMAFRRRPCCRGGPPWKTFYCHLKSSSRIAARCAAAATNTLPGPATS